VIDGLSIYLAKLSSIGFSLQFVFSGGKMVAFELDIRVAMHISVMMYATGRALVFMSDLK
jgi:hypothetical protein